MEGQIVTPDGDQQRDIRRRGGSQHPLEGDTQGVDKVRSDIFHQMAEMLLVGRQA
jgi:hypothetical protein